MFYVLQITCYYGLGDHKRAQELLGIAKNMVQAHNYQYWLYNLLIWELKLDLLNTELPLRDILRRCNSTMQECQDREYYQLVVELFQIKIQVLMDLGAESIAQKVFDDYKTYLEQITTEIDEEDRQNYLGYCRYGLKNVRKFDMLEIVSRRKDLRSNWNELLYNIANVNTVDRIQFLIEKGLRQVISPWQFRLMEYSERISSFYTVQCLNCERDRILAPELHPYIDKAVKSDIIVTTNFQSKTW